MKSGLRLSPSKTFLCSWILRAFISLKRVIITNVLKMIVKCWVGPCDIVSRPLSMSNRCSPVDTQLNLYNVPLSPNYITSICCGCGFVVQLVVQLVGVWAIMHTHNSHVLYSLCNVHTGWTDIATCLTGSVHVWPWTLPPPVSTCD